VLIPGLILGAGNRRATRCIVPPRRIAGAFNQLAEVPLFNQTISQFSKVLTNLSHCLDKAAEFAAHKKFKSEILLSARLVPDQFALVRQVQIACDNAKFAAARLTGKEAPSHPDTEQTIDELKARIQSVVGYLATFTPDDFAGSAERRVGLVYWGGKTLSGEEYVEQYLVPNFYFHAVTAYAIMRHNGVDLGKMDFLGSLPLAG
jgi:hypothetical protein